MMAIGSNIGAEDGEGGWIKWRERVDKNMQTIII